MITADSEIKYRKDLQKRMKLNESRIRKHKRRKALTVAPQKKTEARIEYKVRE